MHRHINALSVSEVLQELLENPMALSRLKDLLSSKDSAASMEARTFPTLTSQTPQILRRRLIWAYIVAMTAIFGTSATAVYIFFNRSLNEHLNHELLILVQSAAPSLEAVKIKGYAGLDKNLPWHYFFEREQGLEWFDEEGKLLDREGTTFPSFPLVQDFSHRHFHKVQSVIQQEHQLRSLTIPVYTNNPQQKTLRLEGYIRASESTREMEVALRQFQLGLGLGGITALILSGITGLYMAQVAVEPITRSFQRLKQFTADASHELRSPLTAICTTVEVMQSHAEQLNPSDVKKLEIISNATAQLTHLVEDLLFLARTDAAAIPSELDWSPIPLDEVLEDVIERFELQAQSKGIDFNSHLLTGVIVKGDAQQLLRLFSNLVDNALKYTKSGGRVSLSLERHKRFALVSMEDTGRGIPSEYLPFIFQRFWRVDKVRTQQAEGVGLGLAIAMALVQRHNGKIKVTSRVGVGSCFQVYLPLAH